MPLPTRRGRSIACALLLCLLASPAEAGGSKEDYARAQAMGAKVRGQVPNERLQSVWVDDHTLVFRRETTTGWRFLKLDARTGDRSDAFDHARVAQALGKKVKPGRLPIRPLAMDGEHLLVHEKGRVWRIGPTIEEVALTDVPALGLAPDGARRSRGGGRFRPPFRPSVPPLGRPSPHRVGATGASTASCSGSIPTAIRRITGGRAWRVQRSRRDATPGGRRRV